MQYRIGTMGFSYTDWLGPFYPKGTRQGDFLAYYSRCYNAVELDTTFHAMPEPDRLSKWAASVPDGFRFSLKVPREISHADISSRHSAEERAADMARFCSLLPAFGNKLGVVLLQLPPTLTSAFAAGLARMMSMVPMDVQFAVEFRHKSWWKPPTEKLLADYGACWCAADYVGQPSDVIPTADFLYIRLIGQHERYANSSHEQRDPTDDLHRWHSRTNKLHFAGKPIRECWFLISNDYAGHAPATVDRYKQLLGYQTNRPIGPPGSLFG